MFENVWDRLLTRFGPDALAAHIAALLPNLIAALLTFVIFYLVWRVLNRGMDSVGSKLGWDATLQSFIENVVKYVLLTIGVVSALGELGVNTAALITSLGVVGLTLGFAARDTLSNLISGVFIFWDRPFVLGDLIEIDGKYGRVDQITMRSTRVVTVDGKMLAIPNANIVNTTVASYTNFPHLRIDIDVTLGVEEDLGRARQIFFDLVANDARFLDTPPPRMVVTALNDYNVAVQFRVWLDDEKEHVATRFDLRERLFETLRTAQVDMPYETVRIQLAQTTAEGDPPAPEAP